MIKFKNFLTEGGLSKADIWKRDNKKLFIQKAVAGELVTTSGDPIDSIPKIIQLLS